MNIDKRLKELIARVATWDVNVEDIKEETILTNDLGYNSIQIIELIVELEKEFDIVVEDEDLDTEIITKYRKLYEMIERKAKPH